MADQTAPVTDDESVYRRVHRSFFRGDLQPCLQPFAFRPNQNDTTGLSVFRASFLRPEDTLANVDPARRNEYYVACLNVADLRALALTVVAEPDPQGPPGHAIIPELNWPDYQADKARCKAILFNLARLASAGIVHQPS